MSSQDMFTITEFHIYRKETAFYIHSVVVQAVQEGKTMEEIKCDAIASLIEQIWVPYV